MRKGVILGWTVALLLVVAGASESLQPFPSNIQIAINQLTTGVTPFSLLRVIANWALIHVFGINA